MKTMEFNSKLKFINYMINKFYECPDIKVVNTNTHIKLSVRYESMVKCEYKAYGLMTLNISRRIDKINNINNIIDFWNLSCDFSGDKKIKFSKILLVEELPLTRKCSIC